MRLRRVLRRLLQSLGSYSAVPVGERRNPQRCACAPCRACRVSGPDLLALPAQCINPSYTTMGSLLSRETEASPGGVDHSTVRLSGTVAPLANDGSITTSTKSKSVPSIEEYGKRMLAKAEPRRVKSGLSNKQQRYGPPTVEALAALALPPSVRAPSTATGRKALIVRVGADYGTEILTAIAGGASPTQAETWADPFLAPYVEGDDRAVFLGHIASLQSRGMWSSAMSRLLQARDDCGEELPAGHMTQSLLVQEHLAVDLFQVPSEVVAPEGFTFTDMAEEMVQICRRQPHLRTAVRALIYDLHDTPAWEKLAPIPVKSRIPSPFSSMMSSLGSDMLDLVISAVQAGGRLEYDTYTNDPKSTVAGGSQAFKQFMKGTAKALREGSLTAGDRLDALVACSRHPDYEDVFGDAPPEILALGYGKAMRGDNETLYIYDPAKEDRRIDMGNGSTLALGSRTSPDERKERLLRRRAHGCIRQLTQDVRNQNLVTQPAACFDCKAPLAEMRRAQGLGVLRDEVRAEGDHDPSVASLYRKHVLPYLQSGRLIIQPSPNHHYFTDGPWKDGVVRDLRIYFRCPKCHMERTQLQNAQQAMVAPAQRTYDAPEAAYWTAHALLSHYGVALEPADGIGTTRDAMLRVPAQPGSLSAISVMRAASILLAVYAAGVVTGRAMGHGAPPPSPPCSPPPYTDEGASSIGSPEPSEPSSSSYVGPLVADIPEWVAAMSPTPSKPAAELHDAPYGMTPLPLDPAGVYSLFGKPIAMPDITGLDDDETISALYEALKAYAATIEEERSAVYHKILAVTAPLHDRLAAMQTEHQLQVALTSQLQGQLTRAEEELQEARAAQEGDQSTATEAQAKYDQLQQRLERITTQHTKNRAQLDSTKLELSLSQGVTNSIAKHRDQLKGHFDDLTSDVTRLRREKAELEARVEEGNVSTEQLAKSRSAMRTLRARVTELAEAAEVKDETIERHQASLAQSSARVAAGKARIAELESSLATVADKPPLPEQGVVDLAATIDLLEHAVEDESRKTKRLQERIEALQAEAAKSQANVAEVEAQRDQAEAKYSELDDQLTDMRATMELQLQATMEKEAATPKPTEAPWVSVVTGRSSHSQLAELEARLAAATESAAESQKAAAAEAVAASLAQRAAADVKATLADMTKQCDYAKRQLMVCQGQLQEEQKKLADVQAELQLVANATLADDEPAALAEQLRAAQENLSIALRQMSSERDRADAAIVRADRLQTEVTELKGQLKRLQSQDSSHTLGTIGELANSVSWEDEWYDNGPPPHLDLQPSHSPHGSGDVHDAQSAGRGTTPNKPKGKAKPRRQQVVDDDDDADDNASVVSVTRDAKLADDVRERFATSTWQEQLLYKWRASEHITDLRAIILTAHDPTREEWRMRLFYTEHTLTAHLINAGKVKGLVRDQPSRLNAIDKLDFSKLQHGDKEEQGDQWNIIRREFATVMLDCLEYGCKWGEVLIRLCTVARSPARGDRRVLTIFKRAQADSAMTADPVLQCELISYQCDDKFGQNTVSWGPNAMSNMWDQLTAREASEDLPSCASNLIEVYVKKVRRTDNTITAANYHTFPAHRKEVTDRFALMIYNDKIPERGRFTYHNWLRFIERRTTKYSMDSDVKELCILMIARVDLAPEEAGKVFVAPPDERAQQHTPKGSRGRSPSSPSQQSPLPYAPAGPATPVAWAHQRAQLVAHLAPEQMAVLDAHSLQVAASSFPPPPLPPLTTSLPPLPAVIANVTLPGKGRGRGGGGPFGAEPPPTSQLSATLQPRQRPRTLPLGSSAHPDGRQWTQEEFDRAYVQPSHWRDMIGEFKDYETSTLKQSLALCRPCDAQASAPVLDFARAEKGVYPNEACLYCLYTPLPPAGQDQSHPDNYKYGTGRGDHSPWKCSQFKRFVCEGGNVAKFPNEAQHIRSAIVLESAEDRARYLAWLDSKKKGEGQGRGRGGGKGQ